MKRGQRRTAVWIAIVAGFLAAPGSALAVAPAKGQSYHGKETFESDPRLEVNAAGTGFDTYVLSAAIPCTDGRRRDFGEFSEKPSVAIAPDGSFSFASKPERSTTDIAERRSVTGIQQTSFTGTFSTADTATVSITTSFRSSKFNCSGTRVLTLSRAGTAGAPFRDGRLATGRYKARGRAIKINLLQVFTPLNALERLAFSARVPCDNGKAYRTRFDLPPAFLIRRGRVSVAGGTARLSPGFRNRGTFRVILEFRRTKGVYRVAGKVRLRGERRRKGQRTVKCLFRTTFTGRFATGPKNLF